MNLLKNERNNDRTTYIKTDLANEQTNETTT